MRQLIRYGTFETNSSSMHSLVVVKDPRPYNQHELAFNAYVDYKGQYELFDYDDGHYDRSPFQVLRTPREKLKYWVAHSCYDDHKEEEISENIERAMNLLKEKTNLKQKQIVLKTRDKYYPYGYVDYNDSGEEVFEYLKRKNIPMEEFVMNPKYVVCVDGDEYQELKKLFDSNILNSATVEDMSSGLRFWSEDFIRIWLNWLDNENWSIFEQLSYINKFIKIVQLAVDDNCINLYKDKFEELKLFFETVRKDWPNIQIVIRCKKDIYDKVKVLDLSLFDYIEIVKSDYSDEEDNVVEMIKLI